MGKRYLQFLFILLISFSGRAQTYSFDNYTVQDGLIQSNVRAIVQDKKGYLWMATESGLLTIINDWKNNLLIQNTNYNSAIHDVKHCTQKVYDTLLLF